MGHQINFFAASEDFTYIEQEIRRIEPLAVLHSRSNTATPRSVPSVDLQDDSQQWLFFYLVRESDLPMVVTEHVPAQGYWTIDALRSPVVEFDRCYFDGRILRRGRVYYVDGFFGSGEAWVEKPEGFRLWAKAILKTIKKCLTKRGSDYIGDGALRWLASSDGKLVQ